MGRYTSPDAVAAALGRTLTVPQQAEADLWIGAAEAWIDTRTGQPWGQNTPVVGELHQAWGELVYLDRRPVVSIQAVTVRPRLVSAAASALATSDYELLDAANGVLWIGRSAAGGRLVAVSYTPAVPLDGRIERAATLLAAAWLRGTVDGIGGDIKSYQIGQELQVTYRDAAPGTLGAPRSVPAEVLDLLANVGGPALSTVFA